MEDGFKQFGANAKSFFNRTLQKTEEAFKTTEKTPLDPQVEDLIKQCEKRQNWIQHLATLTETVIQPDMANRMEDMVLKGLDRKKERVPAEEQLGDSLIRIGKEVGETNAGAAAMIKAGQVQALIGKASRSQAEAIENSYYNWLRTFLTNSSRAAQRERENLENTRLDLDRAKTQLKRTKDDAAKKQVAEQQVTQQQVLFDRQVDTTKRAMEQCIDEFEKHKDVLQRLLNAQKQFHETCLAALDKALD